MEKLFKKLCKYEDVVRVYFGYGLISILGVEKKINFYM